MSIKQHLTTALGAINAEKERAIAQERERVNRELVIPHNAEVDKALNEAIAEVTQSCNEQIAAIQRALVAKKQELVEAGAKKKSEYSAKVIEDATAIIEVKYDAIAATLTKQISDMED